MASWNPPVRDRTVQGRRFPHAATRGMEVHEPRAPPSRPLQTGHHRRARWGRGRETRTFRLRYLEDEPLGLRERSVCAAPVVPSVASGRGSDCIPRGGASAGTGDPREISRSVRPIPGRPFRRVEHGLLRRRRLRGRAEEYGRGRADPLGLRLDRSGRADDRVPAQSDPPRGGKPGDRD